MQQATVDTVDHAARERVSWLGDRRPLQIANGMLIGHLAALVFGLLGLLVAIPNPDLWADSELGLRVYDFGMRYAGSLHIIFGAAAMFFWGVAAIGLLRTAIFFGASVPISLISELLGTSTGEPFGNYAYTDFLGYKILDHVPFSIPLSWFYVGFATYMIGHVIATQANLRPRGLYATIFGAWLLTVWDLVLDPAMAHESLSVRFWEWDETGPYFGMPTQNFIGWTLTALVFMAVARLLWRGNPPGNGRQLAIWFPVAVFAANILFASVLSASVDLWVPVGLAVALGFLPSLLALRGSREAA